MNNPPEPARSQPSDGFIDRDDAANLQRLGGFLIGAILGVASLAQNLELRLHDLQFAAARILFDLPVERNHLPRHKLVLQVSRVKPQAAQPGPALSNGELKDRHAARAKQSGVANFSHHRGHLARTQFGNAARIQAVFVTKRQIMEQVADSMDALASQQFRDSRTNAFHVLYRRGKFKHAQEFSMPMPSHELEGMRPRKNIRSAPYLTAKVTVRFHSGRAMHPLVVANPARLLWCLNHQCLAIFHKPCWP